MSPAEQAAKGQHSDITTTRKYVDQGAELDADEPTPEPHPDPSPPHVDYRGVAQHALACLPDAVLLARSEIFEAVAASAQAAATLALVDAVDRLNDRLVEITSVLWEKW